MKVLGGAVNPMTHCLLSKLIPHEDTGKIFSLITAMQTLTTFVIGSPLYTLIYNNTLTTFPSAFIFVTVILYFFELIVIGYVLTLKNNHSINDYSILVLYIIYKNYVYHQKMFKVLSKSQTNKNKSL